MSDDAAAKLEEMSLADRIAAVAEDVASKRDEYRSIDPDELAGLLGINNARVPTGGWVFYWYVGPREIQDIVAEEDEEYVPELIRPHVTAERYEDLKSNIASLATETSLRAEGFDFLTESEKQKIVRCDMEQQAEVAEDNPRVLAQRSIGAPNGKTLTFEAFIGDGGVSSDMKTPYDDRDGNFTDLSDSYISDVIRSATSQR